MDGNNKTMHVGKGMIMAAGVVALLVGGGIGYAVGMGKDDDKKQQDNATTATDTAAADLRVLLNNLEQEHVSLASAATRAGFDGDPAFSAAAKSLDDNSNALADAVGSVYGDDARGKFYTIWNSHIGFFVDYTTAAKAGDKAGMDQAVANLNGYVEEVSNFFSTANQNLPKDAVKQLVTEHVMLLKAAVDAHGAGDFAMSYQKEQEAVEQIHAIADAIAGAIVKQKPDSFQN